MGYFNYGSMNYFVYEANCQILKWNSVRLWLLIYSFMDFVTGFLVISLYKLNGLQNFQIVFTECQDRWGEVYSSVICFHQ